MDYEKEDIIRESEQLYGEINTCITDIVNARIAKDLYKEGRAFFKMEGLMVATMQHLGCVIDFLEEQKECLADDSKTLESGDERIIDGFKKLLNQIRRDGGLTLNLVPIDKCEAWLEKQKEQKPKFYPGDVIKCTSRGSLWVRCKDNDNIRSDGHTACIGGGFELASEEEAVQFFQELNENGYQWDCIKGRPIKKEHKKEQKPVEIYIDNPNIEKFDPNVKITTSDSSADGDELLYVCNKSYKIGYRDGKRDAEQKPAESNKGTSKE